MTSTALLQSIWHPDELVALVQAKLYYKVPELTHPNENWEFCYEKLNQVSRSFAPVIQELDDELRDPMCIFYLVLRGLDTVEDDMEYEDVPQKLEWLRNFHQFLYQPDWTLDKMGYEHEKELLIHFDKVTQCFRELKAEYRDVIEDITKRMGAGMAEFQERDVVTKQDYDLYCHYVAGLVGIGCSKLFYCSGLEGEFYADADDISNGMGLFLQKTNIIRDYLEDLNDKRTFWPQEVWSIYAEDLADLAQPKHSQAALDTLNHLITDALQHIPDCIEYLSHLTNQQVFNFCAIPQVMAIATLATCYNNHGVFTGVVKIRKGEACKMIMGVRDIYDVCAVFAQYGAVLQAKIPAKDPNATVAQKRMKEAMELIEPIMAQNPKAGGLDWTDWVAATTLLASGGYLVSKHLAKV